MSTTDDARRWGEEDAAAYAASTGYERISFWRRRAERMGVSPIDLDMRAAWRKGIEAAQARDEIERKRHEAEDYARKGDMLAAAMLEQQASALAAKLREETS